MPFCQQRIYYFIASDASISYRGISEAEVLQYTCWRRPFALCLTRCFTCSCFTKHTPHRTFRRPTTSGFFVTGRRRRLRLGSPRREDVGGHRARRGDRREGRLHHPRQLHDGSQHQHRRRHDRDRVGSEVGRPPVRFSDSKMSGRVVFVRFFLFGCDVVCFPRF